MELDYSGAKNREERLAIREAFWDKIHQDRADGKFRELTNEERDAWFAENAKKRQAAAERRRKEAEERERRMKENGEEDSPDLQPV